LLNLSHYPLPDVARCLQIVTDLQLAHKLFAAWAASDISADANPSPHPEDSDKLWDAEQQGLQLTENLLRHHEQHLQQEQQIQPPLLRTAGSSVRSSSVAGGGGGSAMPAQQQQQQQQMRLGGGRWSAFASRRLSGGAAAAAADDNAGDGADLMLVRRSRSETAARYSSSGAMHGYGISGWRGELSGLGLSLPPLPLHEDAASGGAAESECSDQLQGLRSGRSGQTAAAAAAGEGASAHADGVELMPRAHSFSNAPLVPRSRAGVPDAGLLVLPAPPAAAAAAAVPAVAAEALPAAAAEPPAAAAAAADTAAAAAEPQLPAVREAVWAANLGNFSFKGSGTFDMVQIVSDGLSGRVFPYEAPRGKGARLAVTSGRVEGLPDVQLVVPGKLMAAWQAAMLRHAAAAAAGSAAGTAAAAAAAEELGVLQREQSLQSNAPLQREQSLQSAAGQRASG
jgi:hypothetical protein